MAEQRHPNEVQLAERRRRIASMMLAGARQVDVARTLGVDQPTMTREVQAIKQQWRDDTSRDVSELVDIEVARLDRLQMAHWERAIQGHGASTDTVLKIIDKRIKLLGLDAPERHQVDITNETTVEELNGKLAALAANLDALTADSEDEEVDRST